MTGTPLEVLQQRRAFAKSSDRRWRLLPSIQKPGHAMAAVRGGTSSHDFPSVWCTCSVTMKSKSSQLPTVGAAPATGRRDSNAPSNFGMELAALRAEYV